MNNSVPEMSLGIVLPAYRPNAEILTEYIRTLEIEFKPEEIIVELDDPQSGDLVHQIAQTKATVRTADTRRGKGAAITAGFESLDTDILMFLDADGSTPAPSAAKIIRQLKEQNVAVALGSRRHPEATVTSHQTVVRRYLGNGFARLARAALPVEMYDYQCGAKAITSSAWEEIRVHLYENGFAWDLELIAIAGALGHKVSEVPIVWEDHPDSTVDPVNTIIDLSRALIAIRHRSQAIKGHAIHSAFPVSRSQSLVGDD